MSDWTNFANGTWGDATKWTGGVPDAAGATANFTATSASSALVIVSFAQGTDFTVGTLNIVTDADDGYIFRGQVDATLATLRFGGVGGSPAFLNVDTNGSSQGSEISNLFGLRIVLDSDLIVTTTNSDTLFTIAAPITGTGRDIYKFGSGTLRLSGSNPLYTGDVFLNAGRLELTNGSALDASNLIKINNGATLAGVSNNFTLSSNIETGSGNATAILAAATGRTLTLTGQLQLRSSSDNAVTFGSLADTGTVVLSGTSLLNNTGTFNLAGGTLRFGNAGAAANYFSGLTGAGDIGIATGAIFDTGGFAATIHNFNMNGGTLQSTGNALDLTSDIAGFALLTQTGTIVGTAQADRLVFNLAASVSLSLSGASFTSWTSGVDTITVNMLGQGAFTGSSEGETVNGSSGNDTITSGGGADVLNGGGGGDSLQGGAGNDIYFVDNAGDNVVEAAGEGTDLVFTSIDYTLTANVERLAVNGSTTTFAINLTGNTLANEISGNNGANTIDGGTNADIMTGGGGNDTYLVDNAGDMAIELLNQGTDTVSTSVSFTLEHDLEALRVTDAASTSGLTLNGNELANTITGNAGNNIIDGKAGADTMTGGFGNDAYFVDNANDVIIESGIGGTADIVFASVNYTVGDDVERITVIDTSTTFAINLTGNQRANEISGNNGANFLAGLGGDDILIGNGGADTFGFVSSLSFGGVDMILDFAVGVDKIGLDDSEFAGLTAGALPAGAFRIGSAAADADDRIIYNSATGGLFFDADGNGGGAAIQFAMMSNGLALTASDFIVI